MTAAERERLATAKLVNLYRAIGPADIAAALQCAPKPALKQAA